MTPYNVKSKLPFGFEHPELAMFIKIFLICGAIWFLCLGFYLLYLYLKNKHNSSKKIKKHEHFVIGLICYSVPVIVVVAVIIAILIHLS